MRNVEAHLLGDKMDEAVTHYINTHQPNEHVHIDTDGMPITVQDDGSRITVMHQQSYSSHLCRQVSVNEPVGEGPWSEELLDPESRIAAIVAHLSQNPRTSHHQPHPHHKVPARSEVDSVILDGTIRFNGQALEQQSVSLAGLPPMQTLPPLQEMKRCQDTDWFTDKNKKGLQDESQLGQLTDSEGTVLELGGSARQPSRKSLPHKKRISRKLKRNGSCTPQQDLVVINRLEPVTRVVEEEQILPDNYVTVPQATHHMSHEVRPIFICQICGDFYGEEQLKFYHHLKQHYEPHAAIIIDNPVSELVMDKMTNTCIVDNVAALPDSIVELSLENSVPKTMYQPIEKHSMPLNYNNMKMQYSMANVDKEPEKSDIYDSLDKLEVYNCGKCSKTFRKQKHFEAHMREAHPSINAKLEDMGEFSEPEDLMAGIHVCVGEYEPPLLPHLTVENGQVHQDHTRHWYSKSNPHEECHGCSECPPYAPSPRPPLAPAAPPAAAALPAPAAPPPPGPLPHVSHAAHVSEEQHASHSQHVTETHEAVQHTQPLKVLKEEVLQRILESEVPTSLPYNMIEQSPQESAPRDEEPQKYDEKADSAKTEPPKNNSKRKRLECGECGRVFVHRNSLMYHMLSHAARQHACALCHKTFLTAAALKIHKRVHNGDKPHKCELCGRHFRQWSDLKYHTISLHSNEKHFKCEFCGKDFARKYSLNVHRRIHTGERNYKCDYCTKTFSASSYRLTHMRTHTGDRPYKCDECGKCFRSAFDLRRHHLVHDKKRNRFDEQKLKPKDKKKPEKEKDITIEQKTKPSQVPSILKKALTKKPTKKKGAPNVTVQNKDGQFNEYDEFEKPQFTKYKVVYSDDKEIYRSHLYKDVDKDGYAVLRPVREDRYRENTDGKLQIFTHVEKSKDYGAIVSNTQMLDIRHLEREVAREVRTDGNIGGEISVVGTNYQIVELPKPVRRSLRSWTGERETQWLLWLPRAASSVHFKRDFKDFWWTWSPTSDWLLPSLMPSTIMQCLSFVA